MAKFCENCGAELKENSDVCLKCGKFLNNTTPAQVTPQQGTYNGLAVAGFVVSLSSLIINFAGLVGLTGTVLSAIALAQLKDNTKKGKGMAITGIIVGVFSILYGIYSLINLFSLFY